MVKTRIVKIRCVERRRRPTIWRRSRKHSNRELLAILVAIPMAMRPNSACLLKRRQMIQSMDWAILARLSPSDRSMAINYPISCIRRILLLEQHRDAFAFSGRSIRQLTSLPTHISVRVQLKDLHLAVQGIERI